MVVGVMRLEEVALKDINGDTVTSAVGEVVEEWVSVTAGEKLDNTVNDTMGE